MYLLVTLYASRRLRCTCVSKRVENNVVRSRYDAICSVQNNYGKYIMSKAQGSPLWSNVNLTSRLKTSLRLPSTAKKSVLHDTWYRYTRYVVVYFIFSGVHAHASMLFCFLHFSRIAPRVPYFNPTWFWRCWAEASLKINGKNTIPFRGATQLDEILLGSPLNNNVSCCPGWSCELLYGPGLGSTPPRDTASRSVESSISAIEYLVTTLDANVGLCCFF